MIKSLSLIEILPRPSQFCPKSVTNKIENVNLEPDLKNNLYHFSNIFIQTEWNTSYFSFNYA